METMNSMSLSQQIDQFKVFLISKGYSSSILKSYNQIWCRLLEWAKIHEIEYFTPEFGDEFLSAGCGIKHSVCFTEAEKKCIRSIRLLETYLETGGIAKASRQKPLLPPQFSQIQKKYSDHLIFLGQKKQSLKSKLSRTKQFLDFLDAEGIQEVSCITQEHILRFVNFLRYKYSTTARCNILYTVRDFLKYYATEGLVPKDLANLIVTFNTGLNEKMPSCYSKVEVACILESVDRGTVTGKKDYAILILIAKLGLRASDIIHIEIENIKWDASVIEFHQRKTGHFVQLPLTDDVRFALLDYLKNSRPHTTFRNVFIRTRAPLAPYEETAIIFKVVSKYIKKSGIQVGNRHHGPHSLRHSMASALLEEKTPLPVISAALGHSNTKNTARYLRIDIELLRAVALEVPK